jgi:hypothetical protein
VRSPDDRTCRWSNVLVVGTWPPYAPSMGVGVILTVALTGVGMLMLLTGFGSRRRGSSILVTIASAVLFPFAWIEWYVRDELLSGQRRRRV